jgi:large subunit ribosomal protein L13
MKSFMAKEGQVEHKWLLVDAEGAVLGRMASKVAMMLMGKTKPTYTPHVDMGDFVVVVNADKIRLTGNKAEQKSYDWYTGYPGGHKYASFAKMMNEKPERVIEMAVRKMLPKTQMGRKALSKLKVFRGPAHEHQAQQPQKVQLF